ncbi:serine/arginine-rich splicing factor SC35-like [Magnolia sinica]|uniref:serine/arginine-rich splicing factor SC35-like n=1 Tax=Magnolia sinica TaxID=86752 RepID=UPI00265ABA14|nr:serine/arginine-rich splicing factor SC35-like [Magnolia sinica]
MDVVMPRDKESGAFRGFALIHMESEVELARAVSMIHGLSFGGKKILVQRARYGPNLISSKLSPPKQAPTKNIDSNASHPLKTRPVYRPVSDQPKSSVAHSFKDALILGAPAFCPVLSPDAEIGGLMENGET